MRKCTKKKKDFCIKKVLWQLEHIREAKIYLRLRKESNKDCICRRAILKWSELFTFCGGKSYYNVPSVNHEYSDKGNIALMN